MDGSRGNFHSNDEDPSQRRKKNVPSGEDMESSSSSQGSSHGKRVLYQCNYCYEDITGKIRFKCAVCPDFDLCIECFSMGAEDTSHRSNHPYRVMCFLCQEDNLSFSLFCPDWNADDEIMLLEGIEMYGLENWAEVAKHVGTNSKEECIKHFTDMYMTSPFSPLPCRMCLQRIVGSFLLWLKSKRKTRKMGVSMAGDTSKKESVFSSSRVKFEVPQKGSGRLQPDVDAEVESGACSSSTNAATTAAVNKPSHAVGTRDGVVKSKALANRAKVNNQGSRNDGPSLCDLSGYNSRRQELGPEYDNDAQQLLADIEFKDTDTEDERELKLRVLHIYSKRLGSENDVFTRLRSHEDYDELVQTVIKEREIRKKIAELEKARAAGCRTSAEAHRYFEHKRRMEAKDNVHGVRGQRPAGQASSRSANDPDVVGYSGADLLSENEKRLCAEIRIHPSDYLRMQQIISIEIFKGKVTSRSDAHRMFRMEPSKVDRVYDMLVEKGIAPA